MNVRRPYDAIVWWELRRISYNGILLAVGACSFGIIEGVGSLFVRPGEDVVEPLGLIFGGIAFVVGANACYTLGWITELLWSGGDTARTKDVRPTVYRRGVILSGSGGCSTWSSDPAGLACFRLSLKLTHYPSVRGVDIAAYSVSD
jgi:hypothetical protein